LHEFEPVTVAIQCLSIRMSCFMWLLHSVR